VAVDLTWPKITALTVIQSAAGTALSSLGNGAFDVINADWKTVASLSAGSAIATLLGLIVAYRIPNRTASALVGAPAAAARAEAIPSAQDTIAASPEVHVQDLRGARES
jgi:uncharacterized membrane protein YfcA